MLIEFLHQVTLQATPAPGSEGEAEAGELLKNKYDGCSKELNNYRIGWIPRFLNCFWALFWGHSNSLSGLGGQSLLFGWWGVCELRCPHHFGCRDSLQCFGMFPPSSIIYLLDHVCCKLEDFQATLIQHGWAIRFSSGIFHWPGALESSW